MLLLLRLYVSYHFTSGGGAIYFIYSPAAILLNTHRVLIVWLLRSETSATVFHHFQTRLYVTESLC
jgi:hypothetical protein